MLQAQDKKNIDNYLIKHAKYVSALFKRLNLYPNMDQYMIVLESYGIDSLDDKNSWWNYLLMQELNKEQVKFG